MATTMSGQKSSVFANLGPRDVAYNEGELTNPLRHVVNTFLPSLPLRRRPWPP